MPEADILQRCEMVLHVWLQAYEQLLPAFVLMSITVLCAASAVVLQRACSSGVASSAGACSAGNGSATGWYTPTLMRQCYFGGSRCFVNLTKLVAGVLNQW
jgi:hypothetical protein